MIRTTTPLARFTACLAVFGLLNFTVPTGALATLGPDMIEHFSAAPEPAKQMVASRPLSAKDMKQMQGKQAHNPYIAGSGKWGVNYKGVDLLTGNFTTSSTDLTFEGGYGIPVNVTRSYSANSPDEGPFGKGWSLSADIRSTAGGLLKSSGAPVRSIPTSFRDRPTTQTDPNIPAQPVEAVITIDASGKETTIQKDVDGVLTTPPWDKNIINSEYEFVEMNGNTYQVLISNTVETLDGTVYVYSKHGEYPNGAVNYFNDQDPAEPSNVLKIDSATDRQGNVTTYTYSSTQASFYKSNGTVNEDKLIEVEMPNGRTLTFTWGGGGNHITAVTDGTRTVNYGYSGNLLTSVTSPAGLTTTYGYGSATALGMYDTATDLLTSITDPRGLTNSISYAMVFAKVAPYEASMLCAYAYKVVAPNGVTSYIGDLSSDYGATDTRIDLISGGYRTYFEEWVEGSSPYQLRAGGIFTGVDNINATYAVGMADPTTVPGNATSGAWPTIQYRWLKMYDVRTQDLLEESAYTYPAQTTDLRNARQMAWDGYYKHEVFTQSEYNFSGAPLTKNVQEITWSGPSSATVNRDVTIEYAYWGAEKYYQQKAVKDQAGRVSFTDYHDSSASAGSKGQTYRVYSDAFANFSPTSGTGWKGDIAVSSGVHSAEFVYDAKGRATDVFKLHGSGSGYVETETVYNSEGSPNFGAAYSVTEAKGVTGLARTTYTLAYDSIGRAEEVQDASGQVFETVYDLDGQVQSVTRTDTNPDVPIVTYTYGTTGIEKGMVVEVTDELTGSTQTISYIASGSAIGQPFSIETTGEDGGNYDVEYAYTSAGDRETATYITPSGTERWQYRDYLGVGSPESGSRAFQTLTRLDSSGNKTPEEFHYQFDSSGRLTNAAFAQTEATSFTPTGSNPWYDSSNKASVRARAWYSYDPAGRMKSIEHYWDTWGGSSYTSSPILANESIYEIGTGSNRGIKTSSKFYNNSGGSWNLLRTETFGYDADRDYLTSANYNDGQSSATPSWAYDTAGNRTSQSCSYDELNMIEECGNYEYDHDVLGNRTSRTNKNTLQVFPYVWDELNRLVGYNSTWTYDYRADGMRTRKYKNANDYTDFRYDGQMGIQDSGKVSGTAFTTNFGLGARGLDFIEKTSGSTTTTVFPIYDCHGNNVASLSRNGSSYSLADQRSYGAWGEIRLGSQSGDPSGRYVATLGHKEDDESDLIYMRARYHEPARGRFISQDPAMDGLNWFAYANNNPIGFFDADGRSAKNILFWQFVALGAALAGMLGLLEGSLAVLLSKTSSRIILASGTAMLIAWFSFGDYESRQANGDIGDKMSAFALMFSTLCGSALACNVVMGGRGIAGEAVAAISSYLLILGLFMAFDAVEDAAFGYYLQSYSS